MKNILDYSTDAARLEEYHLEDPGMRRYGPQTPAGALYVLERTQLADFYHAYLADKIQDADDPKWHISIRNYDAVDRDPWASLVGRRVDGECHSRDITLQIDETLISSYIRFNTRWMIVSVSLQGKNDRDYRPDLERSILVDLSDPGAIRIVALRGTHLFLKVDRLPGRLFSVTTEAGTRLYDDNLRPVRIGRRLNFQIFYFEFHTGICLVSNKPPSSLQERYFSVYQLRRDQPLQEPLNVFNPKTRKFLLTPTPLLRGTADELSRDWRSSGIPQCERFVTLWVLTDSGVLARTLYDLGGDRFLTFDGQYEFHSMSSCGCSNNTLAVATLQNTKLRPFQLVDDTSCYQCQDCFDECVYNTWLRAWFVHAVDGWRITYQLDALESRFMSFSAPDGAAYELFEEIVELSKATGGYSQLCRAYALKTPSGWIIVSGSRHTFLALEDGQYLFDSVEDQYEGFVFKKGDKSWLGQYPFEFLYESLP
ncbi:MAG: hypothetical protein AAB701_02465 [Patescibacteria group bacterium]